MFKRLFSSSFDTTELCASRLFDNETFYKAFIGDLRRANQNIYIESPFITTKRMNMILPILKQIRRRGVQITVNTRPPSEHDGSYINQAYESVQDMQSIGITVLYTVRHHRKIAIIDDHVLWEGSLNILSQSDSCEMMRRSDSKVLVNHTRNFLNLCIGY